MIKSSFNIGLMRVHVENRNGGGDGSRTRVQIEQQYTGVTSFPCFVLYCWKQGTNQ